MNVSPRNFGLRSTVRMFFTTTTDLVVGDSVEIDFAGVNDLANFDS